MGIVPADPYSPISEEQWARLRERYPDAYLRVVERAALLSGGDLAICEALLRGESVPIARIDLKQARRFGRR